jgi:hypothetical protein
MSTAIDNQIVQSLTQLGHDEKKTILAVIKTFLNLRGEDTGNYISLEEYNNELNEAEVEYEKGNYISNDEMKRQIKSW